MAGAANAEVLLPSRRRPLPQRGGRGGGGGAAAAPEGRGNNIRRKMDRRLISRLRVYLNTVLSYSFTASIFILETYIKTPTPFKAPHYIFYSNDGKYHCRIWILFHSTESVNYDLPFIIWIPINIWDDIDYAFDSRELLVFSVFESESGFNKKIADSNQLQFQILNMNQVIKAINVFPTDRFSLKTCSQIRDSYD